jgi:hypothetical protein
MRTDLERSARALSREADRLIAELHAAIRCRCCPDGLFTRFTADADDGAPGQARGRELTREDFLGMLGRHDVDAAFGKMA